MKANLSSLASGVLFGIGLGVAGMTRPEKVAGFLDFFGAWDASLALVMVGAIAVHSVLYRWIRRRPAPWFDARFHIPTRTDLDAKLLVGAALFGVGWGLGGFCPGPALVSAATGTRGALIFVGTMMVGMLVQHTVASHEKPGPKTVEKKIEPSSQVTGSHEISEPAKGI